MSTSLTSLARGALIRDDRPIVPPRGSSALPDDSHDSERRLAERCAAGDRDAWRELDRIYGAGILVALLRQLGDSFRSEAADLRQDVYVRLYTGGLRAFRGGVPGALRSFLALAARNGAIDHQRKAGRQSDLAHKAEAEAGFTRTALTPELDAMKVEDRRLLAHAILRLVDGPNRDRDLIISRAHFLDGLSPGDIARMGVGMTEKGVETFLRRAGERLLEWLKIEHGGQKKQEADGPAGEEDDEDRE